MLGVQSCLIPFLINLNHFDVKLFFCQTPVCARLIFSMLMLDAELIFDKFSPGAGLFLESEKRHDPLRAFMPVLSKY